MGLSPVSEDVKWQIIGYHKLDMSENKIAGLCGVSRSAVATTVKNWQETGSVSDRPRPGRPRITSDREDRQLVQLARTNPEWSVRKLTAEWSAMTLNSPSTPLAQKSTVSRRLLEIGLESHPKTDKQLLSENHKRLRYEWCFEKKNWSFDKWATVIFSDESNFQLINRKNTPLVRRFKDEKYEPRFIQQRVQAGGGSIGIWGCISMRGTGVSKIYSGRMDQYLYIDTLENELMPSVELLVDSDHHWIFQQDNAPCHKSKYVKQYFDENRINVMPWPARSPD